MRKIFEVEILKAEDFENFEEYFKKFIQCQRKPLLIKSLDVGTCIKKWNTDYLKERLGEKVTKVHSSDVGSLDFISKNFKYKTLGFGDFITKVQESDVEEYEDTEKEFLYLRSLGDDVRKDICDLWKHFPEIADDFVIPNLFEKNQYFSSILRIASKGVQLWTHFDIMDNMLVAVRGCKRVVLFSPEQADLLYLSGDKSRVTDIENPDFASFPLFRDVGHHVCCMDEGDALYIPALWFHNVTNTTATVSVNVFWRHLDASYYDNRDVYGNKDLLLFSSAESILDRAINKISSLPEDYKRFYAKRLIEKIKLKCL